MTTEHSLPIRKAMGERTDVQVYSSGRPSHAHSIVEQHSAQCALAGICWAHHLGAMSGLSGQQLKWWSWSPSPGMSENTFNGCVGTCLVDIRHGKAERVCLSSFQQCPKKCPAPRQMRDRNRHLKGGDPTIAWGPLVLASLAARRRCSSASCALR